MGSKEPCTLQWMKVPKGNNTFLPAGKFFSSLVFFLSTWTLTVISVGWFCRIFQTGIEIFIRHLWMHRSWRQTTGDTDWIHSGVQYVFLLRKNISLKKYIFFFCLFVENMSYFRGKEKFESGLVYYTYKFLALKCCLILIKSPQPNIYIYIYIYISFLNVYQCFLTFNKSGGIISSYFTNSTLLTDLGM